LAESTDILIGDSAGQHVLIRPLARRHPDLFDASDGNWIDCEIQVEVNGFRGSFGANLRSEEFKPFLEETQELSRTLEGAAHFTTMEEQIALTLAGDGKGQIGVSGEALNEAGSGNRLQFGFDVDQSYLPAICESLERLLAAFPVVETPEA
jgi:hypothetical protein